MKTILYFSVALASISGVFALTSDDHFDPSKLPAPIEKSDYRAVATDAKIELGRQLFFDKILSGNQNISCSSCHHPELGSSDGLSLGFGEGALGLGTDRRPGSDVSSGVHERIPRNSPALFNLGADEFSTLFHDGRVEVDEGDYYDGGFITPAKWKLPTGLDNVLAAQAMFPVTSPGEMAGQKGENDIANATSLNNAAGPGGVWELLAGRLQEIPEYYDLFVAAYPDDVKAAEDIDFVMAANAIAAFESVAFRSDESPFDEYLSTGRGLTSSQERGMRLFYGKANCSNCHSGKFQTDQAFHAIAMPQIGPGKSDGNDASYWQETGIRGFAEDFGRGRVTFNAEDNYRFRTPSLRNVELTGPWGHAGSFGSLEDVVRHHLDPEQSVRNYRVGKSTLPELGAALEITVTGPKLNYRWMGEKRFERFMMRDGWVQDQYILRERLAASNELEAVDLSEREVRDLTAFLVSLTDPKARDLASIVPDSVPSGLPVDD